MTAAAAKWESAQPCGAPIKNMASTTASNVCDTTASSLDSCLGKWGLPAEVNQKFAVAAFAAKDKFETFTFSYVVVVVVVVVFVYNIVIMVILTEEFSAV